MGPWRCQGRFVSGAWASGPRGGSGDVARADRATGAGSLEATRWPGLWPRCHSRARRLIRGLGSPLGTRGRAKEGSKTGCSAGRARSGRGAPGHPNPGGGPHSSRPSISCIIAEKQCEDPEPQTVATEGPRRPGGGRGAERPPLALTSIHSTALRWGQRLVEPLAQPPHRVPRGPTQGCGGSVARGQAQGRSAPARAGRAERGFSSRPAGGEGGGHTVPGCRFALCSSLCHRIINTY